jgi:hypothetical protein
VQATRGEDGSFVFVYSASGCAFTVDLNKLTGERLRGSWYDPRTGTSSPAGVIAGKGKHTFQPPTQGKQCDWVLVLDDESKGFLEPGKSER